MIESSLPASVPDKIKISFYENKKKEWVRIFEVSQQGLDEENEPESILHWKKINEDVKERINEIDKNLKLLKNLQL